MLSNMDATLRAGGTAVTGPPANRPQEELFAEVLQLWLQWNEGYEQATQEMFRQRHDQERVTVMMHRLDQLRWRAAELSGHLLENLPARGDRKQS